MSSDPAAKRPSGRRPGKSETRAAILAAAERRFAEAGYAGASLRAIARDAAVDPALISHFFGSKAGLFVAAVQWPIAPEETVAEVTAGDPGEAGRRLARVFLRHWGPAQSRGPILALFNAAAADPEVAALRGEFLNSRLLLPILGALGADRRALRAGLLNAQLNGLGLSRYVTGLAGPDLADDEEIIDAVAPVLQHYLSEPLTGQPAADTEEDP